MISFIQASSIRRLRARQASHGDVADVICFAGSRWRKYTISLLLKVLPMVQNASAVALYPLVKHVLVPLLVELTHDRFYRNPQTRKTWIFSPSAASW